MRGETATILEAVGFGFIARGVNGRGINYHAAVLGGQGGHAE